jgi:hypothetical protein
MMDEQMLAPVQLIAPGLFDENQLVDRHLVDTKKKLVDQIWVMSNIVKAVSIKTQSTKYLLTKWHGHSYVLSTKHFVGQLSVGQIYFDEKSWNRTYSAFALNWQVDG